MHMGHGPIFRAFTVNREFHTELRACFFDLNGFDFPVINFVTRHEVPSVTSIKTGVEVIYKVDRVVRSPTSCVKITFPHPSVANTIRHLTIDFGRVPPPPGTGTSSKNNLKPGAEVDASWFSILHNLETYGFSELRRLTVHLQATAMSPKGGMLADSLAGFSAWMRGPEAMGGVKVKVGKVAVRLEMTCVETKKHFRFLDLIGGEADVVPGEDQGGMGGGPEVGDGVGEGVDIGGLSIGPNNDAEDDNHESSEDDSEHEREDGRAKIARLSRWRDAEFGQR